MEQYIDGDTLVMFDGNTKIIIHSKVACMTDDEHAVWLAEQIRIGNPVLKEIDRILSDYYNNRHKQNISTK